jgi:hypothetical protein
MKCNSNSPDTGVPGPYFRNFMMLGVGHPGPVFPRPAPVLFPPEKDVSGRCLVGSVVVVQIAVPVAAGRFVRHSGWNHFVSCLDRRSLKVSSLEVEADLACNVPNLSCSICQEGLTDVQESSGGTLTNHQIDILERNERVRHRRTAGP